MDEVADKNANKFSISTKSTTITDLNVKLDKKKNVDCEISKISTLANNLRTDNFNVNEVVDDICEDDNKLFIRRNSQSILTIKNKESDASPA